MITESVDVTVDMYDQFNVIIDTYTLVDVEVDMDDDITLEITQ